ncbi:transposase [Francisella tularensis]|uniref:transposase n=1 Tax=Francisella tularensis TaxID=263 RepID=UPI0005063F3B|nr:transposase [Francisella tularensis]KFJ66784.1 hypothetical protein DR83_1236 [Francisella tularensis subsp. novicida]
MDFFFLGLEESLGSDNKFVKLNKLVNFEKFRKTLKGIYTQDMTRQGRPAYDCIMMFKLLLLGQWYSLSDRELASSLRLRIDFMYSQVLRQHLTYLIIVLLISLETY